MKIQEGLSSLQAGGVSPGLLVLFFLCIYVHLPSHTFTGEPVKPASRWRVSKAARAFFHCIHYLLTHSQEGLSSLQAGGLTPGLLVLFFLCIYVHLPSHTFTGEPVKPASRWRVSWADCAFFHCIHYLLTHSQEGLSSLQAGGLTPGLLVLFFLCIHAQLPSHTFTGGPVKPASRRRVSWAACAFLPLHLHASTFSHIHRRTCQACKQVACLLG